MEVYSSSLPGLFEDPRFQLALKLFNLKEWYQAHDAFEDLWHEMNGPERVTIQGLLQLSVAEIHLERNNKSGAIILFGESLGRLKKNTTPSLGLNIDNICKYLDKRLKSLQQLKDDENLSTPMICIEADSL